MPASTVTAAAILKEVYEGDIRKQLNSKTKLLTRIEKVPHGSIAAKYVLFPFHYSRNSGVGMRKEMETLPSPGNQGVGNAKVYYKNSYGAIQLSGDSIDLVDKDINTFMDIVSLETNNLKDDLAVDYNRQLWGDGTGTIAVTSSSTSTATPTITAGLRNVQVNGVYDIITAANLAADNDIVKATVTVTAVGTTTITLSSAVSFTASDVFVRSGNANRELTGIPKIVAASGTLHDVDPNTYPIWASYTNVGSSTNRPLSEGLMITVSDKVVEACGDQPSVIFTSLGVRRAYFSLLEQQRQFVNTKEFTGGFTGLAFTTDDGEIPVVSDKDAPASKMWFLSEKHLKVRQLSDWHWMDRDGSMWYRVQDKDGYGARLVKRSELSTDRRNSHALLDYITEG